MIDLLLVSESFYNGLEKCCNSSDIDCIKLTSRLFATFLEKGNGYNFACANPSFAVSFQKHLCDENLDVTSQCIEILSILSKENIILSSIANDEKSVSVICQAVCFLFFFFFIFHFSFFFNLKYYQKIKN